MSRQYFARLSNCVVRRALLSGAHHSLDGRLQHKRLLIGKSDVRLYSRMLNAPYNTYTLELAAVGALLSIEMDYVEDKNGIETDQEVTSGRPAPHLGSCEYHVGGGRTNVFLGQKYFDWVSESSGVNEFFELDLQLEVTERGTYRIAQLGVNFALVDQGGHRLQGDFL